MNKRKIAKIAADQIAVAVAAKVLTKTIQTIAPEASANHETVTHLIAGIGGWMVQDHFEVQLHKLVDVVSDKIEARKSTKTPKK